MKKIPKCMSTQHPDNVNTPFFAKNGALSCEEEVQEAYYAFSHLGCDEQMWDCEGKEVDNFVVKKLLTKYKNYFKENKLGEDVFLTLRVPNPNIERAEAKILLETLESIPRSFDASKIFYGEDISPIFEVILPMTTSSKSLDRIYSYYKNFVIGKQNQTFLNDDITIAKWIGEFKPKEINVIPLFEDKNHLLAAHKITEEYIQNKDIDHQRVFLARSDPAMNYGLINAVILNKIALKNLQSTSENLNVDIYPIIGIGSAPFRGNLNPDNVERVLKEYPSAHTFSIQSSFKYDNGPEKVKKALKTIENNKKSQAQDIDEEQYIPLIEKYALEYQKQLQKLANIINKVAKNVPNRRKRKLHIGMFGYSRNLNGVSLPRAISFTCALYSIGLPPEVLGINALGNNMEEIYNVYENFEIDLIDTLKYINFDNPYLDPKIVQTINDLDLDFQLNSEHKKATDNILAVIGKKRDNDIIENILRAANTRNFLG
jgi:phosphoenolpyruvate carboxylase